MNASELFPSKYLKKEDVKEPVTLVISHITVETMEGGGSGEQKPVIYWTDPDMKPMVLNRANATTLTQAYGDDSDSWTHQPVTLFADESVMYMGKRVGGIRMRIPASAPAKKPGGVKGKEKPAASSDVPF